MRKNVWIFNHHANNMYFDEGGRHYYVAKYLKQKGYEPVIFCSNAVHGKGKLFFPDLNLWEEHIAEKIDVPFVYIKGRPYVDNGKSRILCMIDYYRNVKKASKEYAKIHGKPDIIIGSQVHPLAVLAAEKLAKKYKVKCIAEFRDLWPEAFVEYGILKEKSLTVNILRKFEKKLYKMADCIVFTSEGAYDYILEQQWEHEIPRSKVNLINNGVDYSSFIYNREKYKIDDVDLADASIFKVVYTGSIRKVNNLGILLDVAKNIQDPSIKILVWGEGDELSTLKERLIKENINNVIFKGYVEKKYIPYITSCADLNLAHNNPSSLFRFGISFNKIFDYFAAGKPILTDFFCPYNPVLEQGAGIEVQEPTAKNIADAIERVAKLDSAEYEKYCDGALKAAKKYDFKNLTTQLEEIIND